MKLTTYIVHLCMLFSFILNTQIYAQDVEITAEDLAEYLEDGETINWDDVEPVEGDWDEYDDEDSDEYSDEYGGGEYDDETGAYYDSEEAEVEAGPSYMVSRAPEIFTSFNQVLPHKEISTLMLDVEGDVEIIKWKSQKTIIESTLISRGVKPELLRFLIDQGKYKLDITDGSSVTIRSESVEQIIIKEELKPVRVRYKIFVPNTVTISAGSKATLVEKEEDEGMGTPEVGAETGDSKPKEEAGDQ